MKTIEFTVSRPADSSYTRIQLPDEWQGREAVVTLKEECFLSTALKSMLQERARQDEKWGEQNHDPFTYLTVLMEEVGELAQCALHARFGGHAANNLRTEAVQCAAVALAICECLDRNKWRWPEPPQGAE